MTPALRFPNFSEPWRKATLGDFFTFKNGINAEKGMYGRGRKFINVLDIIGEAPILHDSIIGSVEISERDFEKNEVKCGDILFQRSSETREEVGQSNIYLDGKSATFGGFVIRGRPKSEMDSRFFDALLKTSAVRKDMTSRSGGSTRYNIGQDALEAVTVHISTAPAEQRKIADFLGSVDERIKLLKRRRDALVQYKAGVMQRLFNQSLRFTRDDGNAFPDWQTSRLGQLGEFAGGGTPDTADADFWNGDIPWVSSSDLSDNSVRHVALTRNVSRAAIAASATKVIPKGSILIVTRVGIGKVAIAPTDLCTSQDFSNLTLHGDNKNFICYWLSFHKNRLLALAQGTSIKGLTTVDLKTLKIDLPHPEEQEKIADALIAFDDKVLAVTDQIDKMQKFKKGLLQQMFV